MATKTDPKVEGNYDSRSLFSDLTFIVKAPPTTSQDYSASAATDMTIPENSTIKVIFCAAGAQVQVSCPLAPRSMDTITVGIPRYQVAMLSKKGATIVNQGGNFHSMSVVTLSTLAPD